MHPYNLSVLLRYIIYTVIICNIFIASWVFKHSSYLFCDLMNHISSCLTSKKWIFLQHFRSGTLYVSFWIPNKFQQPPPTTTPCILSMPNAWKNMPMMANMAKRPLANLGTCHCLILSGQTIHVVFFTFSIWSQNPQPPPSTHQTRTYKPKVAQSLVILT